MAIICVAALASDVGPPVYLRAQSDMLVSIEHLLLKHSAEIHALVARTAQDLRYDQKVPPMLPKEQEQRQQQGPALATDCVSFELVLTQMLVSEPELAGHSRATAGAAAGAGAGAAAGFGAQQQEQLPEQRPEQRLRPCCQLQRPVVRQPRWQRRPAVG